MIVFLDVGVDLVGLEAFLGQRIGEVLISHGGSCSLFLWVIRGSLMEKSKPSLFCNLLITYESFMIHVCFWILVCFKNHSVLKHPWNVTETVYHFGLQVVMLAAWRKPGALGSQPSIF